MRGNKGARYRWVLHAYPKEYREAVGGELVYTANELSGGKWSPRQSLGLLAGGLRTRERIANNGDWLLSAARGLGLALVIQTLSGGLALGLIAAGVDAAPGWELVGGIQPWAVAVLGVFVVALLVRSTQRPTLLLVASLLMGLEFIVGIAGPELFSVYGLASGAWRLLSLWALDRFGDGRGLLSARSVVISSIVLVSFAVVVGDPSLTVVAIPTVMVLGLLLIRLRPTWAFAALILGARGFIVPDASLAGLVGSAAALVIVGMIGSVAVRSVRRLSDV